MHSFVPMGQRQAGGCAEKAVIHHPQKVPSLGGRVLSGKNLRVTGINRIIVGMLSSVRHGKGRMG